MTGVLGGEDLHRALRRRLLETRSADGGFPPTPGATSEPEPTALAALALEDADAVAWLLAHQGADGSFALRVGDVVSDSATSVAALALPPGESRERALDYLLAHRAEKVPDRREMPHKANVAGWGWTPDTFGWVEPTARALLALRLLRPTAGAAVADGVALLEDRECVGGGWNYGNRIVLGESLPPFGQTTAVALVGLNGLELEIVWRGLATLRRLWRAERGGLSLATTLSALRLFGEREADEVEGALATQFISSGLLGDPIALAWATLATGPGLARIIVRGG